MHNQERTARANLRYRSRRLRRTGAVTDALPAVPPQTLRRQRYPRRTRSCLYRAIHISRRRRWHTPEWLERCGLVTVEPVARCTAPTEPERSIDQISTSKLVPSSSPWKTGRHRYDANR